MPSTNLPNSTAEEASAPSVKRIPVNLTNLSNSNPAILNSGKGCKGITCITNDTVTPTLDVTWTDDEQQDGCPIFIELDPLVIKEIRGASSNVQAIWYDV